MKHTLISLVILTLLTPALMAAEDTTLGDIILKLPQTHLNTGAISERLVSLPDDLFPASTGFRYEAIPGIQLIDPENPTRGFWYWVPRDWLQKAASGLTRATALTTGLAAGEALRIYSHPRFSALSTDINGLIQQTILVTLAYRESGYDTRLLDTLYLTWQAAFNQTVQAFHSVATGSSSSTTPGSLQVALSGRLNPEGLAQIPPAMRLAAINAQLYTGLTDISRAIIAERPSSITAWSCLARLARSREDLPSLITALRALEQLEPKQARHTLSLAQALYQFNDNDCTNAAARAARKDRELNQEASIILRGFALKQKVHSLSAQDSPQNWLTLADALSAARMDRELDTHLSNASASIRQSRGWQVHSLDRKGEALLGTFSQNMLTLIMQPRSLPQILGQYQADIRDWFNAALSAIALLPRDPALFRHLALSGLLACILDETRGEKTAWPKLKTALENRYPETSLEAALSKILLTRYPELLTMLQTVKIPSIFDPAADQGIRLAAIKQLIGFVFNLTGDIEGLSLAHRFPDSGAAFFAERLAILVRNFSRAPLDHEMLLGYLDGSRDLLPKDGETDQLIGKLKTGMTALLAPAGSPQAKLELASVRSSLGAIIDVAAGFAALPSLAGKNIFSVTLPESLARQINHLAKNYIHSPAAIPWLKAAVLISKIRTHFDQALCTQAVRYLLDALDSLGQASQLDDGTVLHLYHDTKQLGETILQNLGYCLAELRHADAGAFTASSLQKSTSPAEHIIHLLDHRRVVHGFRQAGLEKELRQLLEMIPQQKNLTAEQRKIWTHTVLTWLLPIAGSDARAIREQLKHLNMDNPLRPSSFSIGSSYSTQNGFVIYSQVTIQAHSTPETWLRP